jgi:hypothetical protein
MRGRGRAMTIAAMRVSLELEATDPVSGRLSDAGGWERAFSGWMELHSALETLVAEAREAQRTVGVRADDEATG